MDAGLSEVLMFIESQTKVWERKISVLLAFLAAWRETNILGQF